MVKICITIYEKGDDMAQVEVVVTGTISGGSGTPLTINPPTATLPSMSVGTALPSTPVATVSGGVAPYTYSFDQDADGTKGLIQKSTDDLAALGLGLAEDGNGNISISGTPTSAGNISFGLIATDSEGAQAQVKFANRTTPASPGVWKR